MSTSTEPLSAWIGRSETLHDTAHPWPLQALAATLDHSATPDAVLPPLWHWLYFLPRHRQSEVGADGHPRRGGFLPPVPLPRRMWAGSQLEFRTPLCIGDALRRRSTIAEVSTKSGRSGELVFVKLRHEVFCNDAAEAALVEHQDIVYREAQRASDLPPPPQRAPADAAWQREWLPDEVLLFRYSALTFNGHRIHYDQPYATAVEGYPGLVVHGPLIATLLLDLLHRHAPAAQVASFRFKALRPTIAGRPMRVNGQPEGNTVRLWAQDHEGWLTMDATVGLR